MGILASSSYTITNLIDGADGKTPYWHTAYANSQNGAVDFSITDSSGRRFIGQYTDYTSSDSADPTKYKWVDMVGSVEVGLRNYILNSQTTYISSNNGSLYPVSTTEMSENGRKFVRVKRTNTTLNPNVISIYTAIGAGSVKINQDARLVEKGMVSFKARASHPVTMSTMIHKIPKSGTSVAGGIRDINITTDWQVFSFWIPLGADLDHIRANPSTNKTSISSVINDFYLDICEWKLESGNIPTPWTLAPEDIDAKIDTKADSELTQEQLNLLLETQNLMTAEMKSKATAEQVDSLIASYNKYVSDDSVNRANTEAALIANAERIEAFRQDYDNKMLQLDFVSNYMRATDLGLEISASDGSSSLLIQKDRISMFSAGKEVMYISQGLIHIDNGVFTKTLQIGNFRESQLDGDPTTNVTIYVG